MLRCCFALALHRVAASLNAPLPELLIYDSPFKNISEYTDKDLFNGFHSSYMN